MLNWSAGLSEFLMNLGLPEELALGVTMFVGALVLASIGPVLVLLLIHITRKVISRIQDRLGPNRLGPWGIFQSVADAVKLLTKEDIRPANADVIAYSIAPLLSVFGVIMSLAVIPFANGLIGVDL